MKNLQLKFKETARRFRKSTKAISPVIATLLMIVIAVAASLVAYAWVMGYIGFTVGNAGKAIQIQSITNPDEVDGRVTVYVQNVGDSVVTLSNIYADGVLKVPDVYEAPDGTTAELGVTVLNQTQTAKFVLPDDYSAAASLTVKVVTTDGNFMELKKTFTGGSSGGGGGGTTYSVDFSFGTGGVSVSPSGTQSYDPGDVVAISATADTGYEFDEWVVTGSIIVDDSSSSSTTATINGAGTITATFTEIVVEPEELILRPNGVGTYENLDLQPYWDGWWVDNYENVADSGLGDGDSSYVYRDTSSGYPSFTIDTYATEDSADLGTINSVTVWIRARFNPGTGPGIAETILRVDGTNYYGPPETLGTSYDTYFTTYDDNPAGGDWTWSAINALECGVGLTRASGGGDARCTQVWIVVNYTPP